MQQARGFTLVELLVAVGILGILVAVAYPVYEQHIVRVHRQSARLALFDLAIRLEAYHTTHHRFSGASFSTLGISEQTDDRAYQLVLANLGEDTFLIEAVPLGPQARRDKACATFQYNESGHRHSTGTLQDDACW